MIDLDKLEAAAKAATKGRRSIEFIESDRHWLFANNVYLGAIDLRRADAEFMAHTDPSDILELIAELRQHQSTVADLSMLVQRLCRQWRKYTGPEARPMAAPSLFMLAAHLALSDDEMGRVIARMREIGAQFDFEDAPR